jgi:integrase
MATVLRQPGTQYWIAAFRDATGKQHRRSTGETTKTRALEVAKQFERVSKGKGNRQRVRNTFADFYREHFGIDLPFASVRTYCQNWLSTRTVETAKATSSRYEIIVERFLESLGESAETDLNEITKSQITLFRDSCLKRYATRTANTYLKIVKMVFRSARLDGYLWQDPAEGVKTVKTRDSLTRRPFSMDELRSILAVADPEWQSLIKFGLYTGQRLSDLASITWSKIDLDRDEIRIKTRKTGKTVLISIAAPLREHLISQPASDNPQSPVHPRSYAILQAQNGRVGTLSNQFTELLVAAGLREPRNHQSRGIGREGKRVGMDTSFHSLRHTAVSLLKDAGIPDAVVMALVGHESAAMSQRYTHVGKESLAKAAAALPDLSARAD